MTTNKLLYAERCALRHAIDRCHNTAHPHFTNYGARGIRVCDAWRDPESGFEAFIAIIGPRPSAAHSLDRIDNDGNYEPGNVRWADRQTQQRNRRKLPWQVRDYGWGVGRAPRHISRRRGSYPSPLIEHGEKKQTLAEWSAETGLKAATIRQRFDRGWSIDKVLDPTLYNPSGTPRRNQ